MIILPSFLEKFESLKDRTVKLTFGTMELTPEQLGEIGQALQREGYLAFKDDAFKSEEKELLENLESDFDDGRKTQAQRLRAVLYRLWERKPEGYEDSELFYRYKTEKVIEHFKKQLDD